VASLIDELSMPGSLMDSSSQSGENKTSKYLVTESQLPIITEAVPITPEIISAPNAVTAVGTQVDNLIPDRTPRVKTDFNIDQIFDIIKLPNPTGRNDWSKI
ncbi:unnamed protein product, partial [Allacma fusca]